MSPRYFDDGDPRTGDPSQMPVDLGEVRRYDRVLDDVGSDDADRIQHTMAALGHPDGVLFRRMLEWQREIKDDQVPELVDVDTALGAIEDGRHRRKVTDRALPPFNWIYRQDWASLSLALGSLLIIIGCYLGIDSIDAHPDHWLYPVREFLYGPDRPPPPLDILE